MSDDWQILETVDQISLVRPAFQIVASLVVWFSIGAPVNLLFILTASVVIEIFGISDW